MKDTIELEIGPDGIIRTIYQDGIEAFAEEIGASVKTVCRASHVEWEKKENGEKGWSVRSVHDPELAARMAVQDGRATVIPSREGELILFLTREAAIEWEVAHFFDLLPPKEQRTE
jgi:hypothetical protein